MRRRIWRVARAVLTLAGAGAMVLVCWLALGWPIGIDRWLDASEPPAPADAVVCLGGGTGLPNLPTPPGWERIYTTVQLMADRYAPIAIFSGRGSMQFSEAETYAEAATWLGLDPRAIVLDPAPASTAEHAVTLLAASGGRLTKHSRLLLVTSRSHARRALLVFKKQGFTNVRVVSEYGATRAALPSAPASPVAREAKVSAVTGFTPSHKSHRNVFSNLRDGSTGLVTSMQEVTAIAWYWWQGWV